MLSPMIAGVFTSAKHGTDRATITVKSRLAL
jgi:hypothetical protein